MRRDRPLWPFVWRGLLPLLGLLALMGYAVGPFAVRDLETVVRSEVQSQLDAAGFGWARLAVSGQDVHLSGVAPDASAGAGALALARMAACPSAWGRLTCAVVVTGAFDTAAAAPQPPAPAQAAAVATPALPPVAEPAPQSQPLPETPPPALAKAAAAAAACADRFKAVLGRTPLNFRTGLAVIDADSAAALDQLAEVARGCGMPLLIEGHTDATGSDVLNQPLSQARAEAVRQALITRGVAADQLTARGLGAARPIDSNDSESGRSRNRRIEFRPLAESGQ